ncbi:NADH2 dehydrogenase 14K chain [Fonsecaea pedrosoi]|nr:NADH2 dehydrogenase 14K chain [Fonsecaea pedrosoi]
MVHKILFWAGFGIATRFVQLGIEMRPFFQRGTLWVYPLFASIGGSFGYWLTGVEDRQVKLLQQRKQIIIEKRRRRAEREAAADGSLAETAGVLASTS